MIEMKSNENRKNFSKISINFSFSEEEMVDDEEDEDVGEVGGDFMRWIRIGIALINQLH